MADLFISYAREDAARADAIAQALSAEGFTIFWDKQIPAGQTWADFTETKLLNSVAILVLWSEASTKSQWVREEARIGRDAGKLIPVQIDAAMPPFGFGEVQAASLRDWHGDRSAPDWQRFVAAIRFAMERGGAATPPPAAAPPGAPPGYAPSPPAANPYAAPPPQQQGQPAYAAQPNYGATNYSPAGQSTGPNKKMLIAGGVGAVLAALVGYAYLERGPSSQNPPQGATGAMSANAPAMTATLPASVQAVLRDAAAAEQAGRAAAEQAAQLSGQGMQAANAGTTNQGGYAVQQMPNGAVLAGDLSTLVGGRPALVGVAAPNGLQFYGQYHQLTETNYTMQGAASWGAMNAAGNWRYTANTYDYVGVASIQGKYNGAAQESGSSLSSEGAGVGVFTFPDGRRYAGQYRSVGEGPQGQIFMHGLGALYAANGDLMQAGRFDNDRLVAPE